jgi:hypothetical protein
MKRVLICVAAALLSFIVFVTAPVKPHGEGMALHTSQDTIREAVIFGLAVLAIITGVSILIRGKPAGRVVAVIACLWPCRVVWVFGQFIFEHLGK